MMDHSRTEGSALAFAVERHGDQLYGHRPYLFHLSAVRGVLAEFGYHGSLGLAAWLHDTIEDTKTTHEELAGLFGDEVTDLVWAVTGVGHNRKTRNANAYEKIRAYPQAAILKLADRIANVEASAGDPGKLSMYREEMPALEAALAWFGDELMWARLRAALKAEET